MKIIICILAHIKFGLTIIGADKSCDVLAKEGTATIFGHMNAS